MHRDLKPENVFLAGEAKTLVKLLDFGLAKSFAADTEGETAAATGLGMVVGTVHYMGPEQLRGQTLDVGWDLWAIAVMTYEMLVGALPFVGETPADYQSAVLTGRVERVPAHVPAADRLAGVFERALSPDPSRRPLRASGFVAELERTLG